MSRKFNSETFWDPGKWESEIERTDRLHDHVSASPGCLAYMDTKVQKIQRGVG